MQTHTYQENRVPKLSVVVVLGQQRARVQHIIDLIYAQTAVADLELILVDVGMGAKPLLQTRCPTQYISKAATTTWGEARSAGVRVARAPVVALLEDHCFPGPEWAEALLEVHEESWDAICYAFKNPNPETYASRAGFMAELGIWAHPVVQGPMRDMPGNNMSYKKAALLRLEPELDEALNTDFAVQSFILQQGGTMGIAAEAYAAHQNYDSLRLLFQANYVSCRLVGAERVRMGAWSLPKRFLFAALAPLGAPLIKFKRLLLSMKGRPTLWGPFVKALPVTIPLYCWAALGEAQGYLQGRGSAEEEVRSYCLTINRLPRTQPAGSNAAITG